MKILLDMTLSPKWVRYLTATGVHAIHWSSVGSANAPDSDIMDYARTHNFVILTQDLDFTTLLAFSKDKKPSVPQLRAENTDSAVIGVAIVKALRQAETMLDEGALLTIDTDKVRLNILPLRQ
ncbi:MAG: DUF5615 family PIN-like protein [Desulfovibrio sp.]|nr:DUF5615 family PIN-like protein [Desulfovibrio sp.]